MAIYHLTARAVSRAKGHSAVAATAYRAGERLHDARSGRTHDYRRRHGVLAAEILAPDGAPAWMRQRDALWNSVELIEKRKDACVARELEVALPRELTRDAHRDLVRGFVAEQLTARGVVSDIAWHTGRARDGGDNDHAHILFTTRPLLKNRSGFGKKDRGLEHKATLYRFREAWRDHVNRRLEEAGDAARIDHRTLYEQGVARHPEHLGRAAIALEQSGIETDKGNRWRDTRHRNKACRHALPGLARAIASEAEELEMLSAAQARTHRLLELARRSYTGGAVPPPVNGGRSGGGQSIER
jgi:ATP-dependent exoDNAse (exonuclease V) alpha subunit